MSNSVNRRVACTDDGALKSTKTAAFGTVGIVVAATPTRVYKLTVHNGSATPYFLQVHNKATAPVNTEVPIWEVRLPASGSAEIDFDDGLFCSLGFSLGLSSTLGVLTLAGAADATVYVQRCSRA